MLREGWTQAEVYSTTNRRTVSLQNESGNSPARPLSTPNFSCSRIIARTPVVGLMACGEAVGGRESERHLSGRQVRVRVLAADCEAWSAYKWSAAEFAAIEIPRHDAHTVKLRGRLGGAMAGWDRREGR